MERGRNLVHGLYNELPCPSAIFREQSIPTGQLLQLKGEKISSKWDNMLHNQCFPVSFRWVLLETEGQKTQSGFQTIKPSQWNLFLYKVGVFLAPHFLACLMFQMEAFYRISLLVPLEAYGILQ